MTTRNSSGGLWAHVPVWLRAVVSGLLIGMIAANVWPLFLRGLGALIGAIAELIFLGAYMWWAGGGGPRRSLQAARAEAFRRGKLSSGQWCWGILAALCFAVTVHAAIVLLFRLVPFPVMAFRAGYDFSFIPTLPLRWLAVVVSATSAGICEETGFRGYMQEPMERRYGPGRAIIVSSLLFMALHLTKAWSLAGMVPIVFGAGVLLGLLAWASRSLVFCMIGHAVMDVGLFAFWWTGIAGTFTKRPIGETGVDMAFLTACAIFAAALFLVVVSIMRLRRLGIASRGSV
jgi:membrane protease YdiL (CAAX protease family)